MDRVDIKVGFYCNNHCSFCVQGEKRKTLPAKDTQEVMESLQEAYDKGKREVVLTGGEPTMHPEFLKLVKIAKDIGFDSIQIQTNGRMFAYPEFCKKTIKAGATQFSPSLHGMDAETHDALTEIEGSYDQTVTGISNLVGMGQEVLMNSVITSSNYKQAAQVAELFVELGVSQFQFAFIHILGSADKNKNWIVPRKTDVLPYIKKGLDIANEAGIFATTEAIPFCLMKGYEKNVAESYIPETTIYDAGYVVDNYTERRIDHGKKKCEGCKVCKYYKKCEGPWKEYIDIYGWDEFVAVEK